MASLGKVWVDRGFDDLPGAKVLLSDFHCGQ